MPILPENKGRYPKTWNAVRARILARAGDRCECRGECGSVHRRSAWNGCRRCNARNGAWGWRAEGGAFHEVRKRPLGEAKHYRTPFEIQTRKGDWVKVLAIVLTVAHLNHRPEDCRDSNLKAMCQRCHLRYDRYHHSETRTSQKSLLRARRKSRLKSASGN